MCPGAGPQCCDGDPFMTLVYFPECWLLIFPRKLIPLMLSIWPSTLPEISAVSQYT